MKFKKYKYNPTRKMLFPFRTTKVCSLTWNLAKYSFVLNSGYLTAMVQWQSPQLLRRWPEFKSSMCIFYFLTMTSLGAPVRSLAQASYLFLSSSWDYISPNDFWKIWINFGNEFWLILCQEYINSKLLAVSTNLWGPTVSSFDGPVSN